MNEEIIREAIEEIKTCRRQMLMYYISVGEEKTLAMQEMIQLINVIDKFEEAFEQIRFKYNAMQQVK